MVKDTNYIIIPGWAVTKLKLKGNNLLIFSVIYGFSQDKDSYFSGSLEYLQNWTNSTRQGVINSIKTLLSEKLIIKEEAFPYNKYKVNYPMLPECKKSLTECKQNLQNNIDINNNNNIDISKENDFTKNLEISDTVSDIIKYMNSVCGTHFRTSSSGIKKIIKARLNEGFKFDDFKDVIDFKYKEWGLNPVKFANGQLSSSYLRPSTLFNATHFEEYLQAAWINEYNSQKEDKVKSEERSEERSDIVF